MSKMMDCATMQDFIEERMICSGYDNTIYISLQVLRFREQVSGGGIGRHIPEQYAIVVLYAGSSGILRYVYRIDRNKQPGIPIKTLIQEEFWRTVYKIQDGFRTLTYRPELGQKLAKDEFFTFGVYPHFGNDIPYLEPIPELLTREDIYKEKE